MIYDMSDVKIRAMVEAQHSPREFRGWSDCGIRTTHTIDCNFCYERWPCDARRQLLAWREASATPRDDEIKIARTIFDNGEGP